MTPNSFPATPSRFRHRLLTVLLLGSVVATFTLLARNPALQGVWPWEVQASVGQMGSAIGLADYQVQIEAMPIIGVSSDVSGLTYDPDRRTLFAITNKRPEIIELSLQGEVLRRLPVSGLEDPEAIEYIAPGLYVIADERLQALVEVRIDEATTAIDTKSARRLSIGMERSGNRGFEGLAYDRAGDRLFVAKEKKPMRIYEVSGFPSLGGTSERPLHITNDAKRDAALPVRDLSSLYFDAASGHLLLLSDESRLVVELDAQGRPLARLALRKGRHGLVKSVPQAEGLSMDDAGRLYVVSEPNLFYVFSRQN
ncbi:MAG: DNA-binding protein [Betaproteobacteria bacterium HGW-Betaproteobacteria-7]|nr:MAG: DNA-binding protein [Betaproteobacteria bacterium HGW-Betaproteobacteria-7]